MAGALLSCSCLAAQKEREGEKSKQTAITNTIIYAPQPLHKEIRSLAVRFHIPVPSLPTYRTTYESCAWPTMCIWLAAGPSVECTHTLRGAYACVIISWSCGDGSAPGLTEVGAERVVKFLQTSRHSLKPAHYTTNQCYAAQRPPMLTDSSLSKTRLLFWGKALCPLS